MNEMLKTVPVSSSAETAVPRELPFDFRGQASEYFGIWIVNVLLSIITLGIYSAWAKVRRLRYFYGNTWLDGYNFDYHAQPRQILIGRLIVVAILAGYYGLLSVSPAFALLGILLGLGLPWIMNNSIRFNARMTSYRNVRFGFEGSYRRASWVFLVLPFLGVLSLGLLMPVASRAASHYLYSNLRYGSARFQAELPLSRFYENFGLSILVFLGMTLLVLVPTIGAILMHQGNIGDAAAENLSNVVAFGFFAAVFVSLLFYRAGVRNIAVNQLELDGRYRFRSTFNRLGYGWMMFCNLAATVLTLGLMRPWAAIRTWRYTADRTSLMATADLSEFVGHSANQGSVAAAEYSDIELVNVGF
jgi:uncharacterized membrane protein YjgN (DUF898 family)